MSSGTATAAAGEAAATSIDLVAHYRELFSARAPRHEAPGVAALRTAALEAFGALGLPRTRWEEWRRTPLGPVARTAYVPASAEPVAAEVLEPFRLAGCSLAVFVDGHFVPALSDLGGLPDGVEVASLGSLVADEERISTLGRHVRFQQHPFVALNTALWEDGAFVRVPRGVVVETPIHLLFVATGGVEPAVCFPRNLFLAGEDAQVQIVEQFASLGEGAHLTVPLTEVRCEPAAVVDHYKLGRESLAGCHLGSLHLHQERGSNFSSHCITWGGDVVRNDVHAILAGEGCDSNLNGLYLVEGNQLVDNHMRVEHAAPHCSSHELYKGILEGRSRAVFSGRIYVHEGAQKTDAKQTNRNLLLSEEALVNSNPQLEIFADDVKCTHGSTVGRLDELAIFYLRSRGIGEEAARSLLTYAFASDIVGRVRVPALRRELEEFLFRRLPKGEIVRQAV